MVLKKGIVETSLLPLLFLSFTISAQWDNSSGKYFHLAQGQKYHLQLNSDGTFLFSQYWKLSNGLLTSSIESGSEHGQGTWIEKNGRILFYANLESDINRNYRLNLNNTVAQIENDSGLIFVKSEIFWIQNLKMEKSL